MENVDLIVMYAGHTEPVRYKVAVTPGGSYENIDDVVYDKVLEEINKNLFDEGPNGYTAIPCLDEAGNEYVLFLLFRNIASVSVIRG